MGGVEERIHTFITTGPQGPVDAEKLDAQELKNILEETMKLLTGKRDPRITQRVGYSATGPGGNFTDSIGKDTGL